jgi:hypothetical protein
MSLAVGGLKACAVSPSAGTLIPPFPVPGSPFFAPVYGYLLLKAAAGWWLALNGQLACRFSLARGPRSSVVSIPCWPGTHAYDDTNELESRRMNTLCMLSLSFDICRVSEYP